MILVHKSAAFIFFIVFTLLILALGIYGYYAIGSSEGIGGSEIKLKAENMLLIAIVSATSVMLVFLCLVGRTVHISRELDKLIRANKYGDFSPELSMKRLGKIGEKINLLYFALNTINEKKTLKISALSELVEYLVQNIQVPLIVSDVLGNIVYVSRNYADKFKINRSEILNTSAAGLYPSVEYHDTVLDLDKRNSAVEREMSGGSLTLVPVNNKMNALSYVIWIFDKSGFVAEVSRNVELRAKNGTKLLSRLFGRRNIRG